MSTHTVRCHISDVIIWVLIPGGYVYCHKNAVIMWNQNSLSEGKVEAEVMVG